MAKPQEEKIEEQKVFTEDQLKMLGSIMADFKGNKDDFLESKGAIIFRKRKDGFMERCVVRDFMLPSKMIDTGLGEIYTTDIPFSYWNEAFSQLSKYQDRMVWIENSKMENLASLSENHG